jgi:hypothetical protein
LPGGDLATPGYYTLRIRATDAAGNHKNIQRQLVVSHDWVEWTTRVVTRPGKAFQLKGTTRDGVVKRPSPRYSNGVRLLSNSGSASVVYAFPVVAADAYRSMTFRVRGMSANGHQAVISIWNPDLGAYKYLGTYDAAVAIGPSYGAWQTTADGAARVVDGTVRGAVSTWKDLGASGKSIFDVSNVTLEYESGTLMRAATVAAAGGASADLLADYIADAPRGLQGRTARSLLPFRYGPILRWAGPPTEPTEPEVSALKLRLFPKTVTAVVGARKFVSAWTCPAEDRSPWGPDGVPGTTDDDCDPVVAEWALEDPASALLNKTTSHKVLVQPIELADNRLVATYGELKRPLPLTVRPRPADNPLPPPLGEEPALKLRLFPKTVTAVVGARKFVSAWTCPAEDRSPWGSDGTPGTSDDDCDPVVAEWALADPASALLNKTTSHKVLVQPTELADNRIIATSGELKRPAPLSVKPRPADKPMPPPLGEE